MDNGVALYDSRCIENKTKSLDVVKTALYRKTEDRPSGFPVSERKKSPKIYNESS